MKVGIFGCTADPFTEAHAAIVGEALAQSLVDRVIIAPTIVDWHREGKTSWLNDGQKCELINIMLENDPRIKALPPLKIGYWEIWDKDFKLREICKASHMLEEKYVKGHRFIDTLVEIIKSKEWNFVGDKKDNEYYVILGTDSFLNFKSWGMWQEIPKLAKLIVVKGRDNANIPPSTPELPYIGLSIASKYANVSASNIRKTWMSKGFEAYKKWVASSFDKDKPHEENDKLLHTPIFDVVKGKKAKTGLEPIKISAPDWVSIMVEKDGKLLVEKQFRYGADDFIEEFPSGTVEKDDEDPLATAVRELEEETGIKLLDKTEVVKLGQTNPNPAFMTNMMHYYYVNLDHAKYEIVDKKLDVHEEIEISWKDKDRFMFDLADDAHACRKTQVPAIALAMVKLYENASNYPSGG